MPSASSSTLSCSGTLLYMDAVLKQLRAEGYPVRDEDVARLAPTIRKHINMNGRYSFAIPESVAQGRAPSIARPCCR